MNVERWVCLPLAVVITACVERQADLDDEPELVPTCMILPARGYWEDGTTRAINNEWGTVGSVCLCLTEEERESEPVLQELNDLAYEECERISTLHWDFDWTDCEEMHESGAWLGGVFVARGEHAWKNPTGLTCEEAEAGCSVRGHRGAAPLALFLAVGLLGLQLRRT